MTELKDCPETTIKDFKTIKCESRVPHDMHWGVSADGDTASTWFSKPEIVGVATGDTEDDGFVTVHCTPGMKADDGKDRWDLLDLMFGPQTLDIVRGLQYGAKKYNEDPDDPNYRKVKNPRRRFYSALRRHVFKRFIRGEKIDAESGVPHLALAAVNILFLMWHDDEGNL